MADPFWSVLGCGVGLRAKHYPEILSHWPSMDFFEAVTENYMDSGGRPLQILEKVRHHYPVALHGVSLSIGSADPLKPEYLQRLKSLADRIDPFVVSDHLCWAGVDGESFHDLLPLPFTEEAIDYIAGRVGQVQDALARPILLENVSAYVTYKHSTMPEWEFLREVAERSGCGILLDLNNIYVNATNHGFDPYEYLKAIPARLVGQFHLGGHTDLGAFLFDTHSKEVIDPVWALYRKALELYGNVSTLIEWDEDIPPFTRLSGEAAKARNIYRHFENQPKISHQTGVIQSQAHARRRPAAAGSLAQVQRDFKSKIQPGAAPTSASLALNPQGGVPGEQRIAVYANGYTARIHEALSEVYEAIRHGIGDDPFMEMAEAYAKKYPSHEYNLSLTGRFFPEFLKTHELARKLPFLVDVARLEWAVAQSFHAFDQTPLESSGLAGLSPEDWNHARLVFQPSVAVVASLWPILDLWRARKHSADEAKIELENRPQTVLVFRQGVEVYCDLLDSRQQFLLEGLQAGRTLGKVCGELADQFDDDQIPVAEWFSGWMKNGLIIRCDLNPTPLPHPT